MPLNTPIALGFTAEIYAWKDGQVLMLFNPGISRSTVETEVNLTRLVQASGLPVPVVDQIVEIDGRFGLEYERVDGNIRADEARLLSIAQKLISSA
jgi:hypothetical protein